MLDGRELEGIHLLQRGVLREQIGREKIVIYQVTLVVLVLLLTLAQFQYFCI